jgi:flagellar basal-body rod protein FlgC
MDFFTAMEILSSGLGAERVRMNVTSSNLANAQTTRTPAGGPYQRRDPVFTANVVDGDEFGSQLDDALRTVEVTDVVTDPNPPRTVYDPGHPDADAKGLVQLPNVNMVEEMVNMLTAARSYEASLSAMRSVIDMAHKAMTLGR